MASAQSVESSYEAIAADLASSQAFASKPWEEQLKEMNFALRGRPVMPLVELLRGYGVNSFPQVRTTAMPDAWLTHHLSQSIPCAPPLGSFPTCETPSPRSLLPNLPNRRRRFLGTTRA